MLKVPKQQNYKIVQTNTSDTDDDDEYEPPKYDKNGMNTTTERIISYMVYSILAAATVAALGMSITSLVVSYTKEAPIIPPIPTSEIEAIASGIFLNALSSSNTTIVSNLNETRVVEIFDEQISKIPPQPTNTTEIRNICRLEIAEFTPPPLNETRVGEICLASQQLLNTSLVLELISIEINKLVVPGLNETRVREICLASQSPSVTTPLNETRVREIVMLGIANITFPAPGISVAEANQLIQNALSNLQDVNVQNLNAANNINALSITVDTSNAITQVAYNSYVNNDLTVSSVVYLNTAGGFTRIFGPLTAFQQAYFLTDVFVSGGIDGSGDINALGVLRGGSAEITGTVTTSGVIIASSRKIKTNIISANTRSCLDDILGLGVVLYNYNSTFAPFLGKSDNETVRGLIAEDTAKVNSAYGTEMDFQSGWENVTVGNRTKQAKTIVKGMGVVYTRIIPDLIGSTQELYKLIVAMNTTITELQARIFALGG
jgi:hypothetical protein